MGLLTFFKNLFGNTNQQAEDPLVDFFEPKKMQPKKTVIKYPEKKIKTNKTKQVREHLQKHGEIKSWGAINKFGATRLSDIIYRLRRSGMNIETVMHTELDRNGNVCNFATYKLIQSEAATSN